jgi:hypothetical protein
MLMSAPIIRAIGVVLLIVTVLCFVADALGLFGVPFLKERWEGLIITGAVLSLVLFAVTWTGDIAPFLGDRLWTGRERGSARRSAGRSAPRAHCSETPTASCTGQAVKRNNAKPGSDRALDAPAHRGLDGPAERKQNRL